MDDREPIGRMDHADERNDCPMAHDSMKPNRRLELADRVDVAGDGMLDEPANAGDRDAVARVSRVMARDRREHLAARRQIFDEWEADTRDVEQRMRHRPENGAMANRRQP
ncbi:MAG TPA: hypothetical protein VH143_30135 [Kofleriaceae bacterium]|jgi:hypothetical protein|nr:hypothetical protein [Kofleriaceae bacterium]